MSDRELVLAARGLLTNVTPLKRDCGELCGAACCKDPEDGEIMGMALFPGEKLLYEAKSDWYKLYYDKSGKAPVLVCTKECPREQRPLACRIFPLTPYSKKGRLTVCMDARARSLCPLFSSGKSGLSAEFSEAVSRAMRLLWQSAAQRSFIEEISRQIDDRAYLVNLFEKTK